MDIGRFSSFSAVTGVSPCTRISVYCFVKSSSFLFVLSSRYAEDNESATGECVRQGSPYQNRIRLDMGWRISGGGGAPWSTANGDVLGVRALCAVFEVDMIMSFVEAVP